MAGEVDLHRLLAGPVIAMNDAQADAAASFYEMFDRFAFEPAETAARGAEPAPRQLRMISFVAERATPEGIERRQISMPLLQMIPIAGVAIDSAKIQFSLAVNAEPDDAARASDAAAVAGRDVAMKARIAPSSTGEAAAGNLQVEIVLKQTDLPGGYLDMIAETQGGMSRALPATAPAPDMPLFTATLRKLAPSQIIPGNVFRFELHIEPNPGLVGTGGLQIMLASAPERALSRLQPLDPVRIGKSPGAVPGSAFANSVIAGYSDRTTVSLLVTGVATGPDGVAHRHSVNVVLPRASKTDR
jgi:hypothetical protein